MLYVLNPLVENLYLLFHRFQECLRENSLMLKNDYEHLLNKKKTHFKIQFHRSQYRIVNSLVQTDHVIIISPKKKSSNKDQRQILLGIEQKQIWH